MSTIVGVSSTGEVHMYGTSAEEKAAPRAGDTFYEADVGRTFEGDGNAWVQKINPSVAIVVSMNTHNHDGAYEALGAVAAHAKADVFIAPMMVGGDGALDPIIGTVTAQFK